MNDLTDTEVKILFMLRQLKMQDRLEIRYTKHGEISWQLVQSHTGKFDNYKNVDNHLATGN